MNLDALNLPINAVIEPLKQALSARHEAVLEAPPGAGKTTVVPLALLNETWLADKKIVMLEPRRIAAKSAATRMADLLGETVGQTIGYRMRLDTKVSQHTKIEVITEGILLRMLQSDPSLAPAALIIFDEFHERNLDSDLALSLSLQGRCLFRDKDSGEPPLKILVMSATLDSAAIANLLDAAPVISSEGRTYPVDIIYGQASQARERIVDRVVATIKRALSDHPDSSILAFLPGQGEIKRTAQMLQDWLIQQKIRGVHLHSLFGNLSIEQQQQAIAPLTGQQAGEQKVVLATNIAETSLTIDGVDIVVDSGLVRESRFNPATGMAGLHTVKISAASSTQRAGRAGRLRPGKCYRLWSESQQQQLAIQSHPEVLQADLAPMALQLLQWGINDPQELCWLDPPPNGAWQQALALLKTLDAIDNIGQNALTAHGKAMAQLPLHPRLAHLLMCGMNSGLTQPAAQLASVLAERDPFSGTHPELSHRLEVLSGRLPCPPAQRGWLHRTQQLAKQIETQATGLTQATSTVRYLIKPEQVTGYLLACAYPDRIARRRHSGRYQLSNGRSAAWQHPPAIASSQWLVVAEVSGMVGGKSDVIRSAAALDVSLFEGPLDALVTLESVADWDQQVQRFVSEDQERIGLLVLSRQPLTEVPVEAKRAALIRYIRKQGLAILPWKAEQQQWCARVRLLRSVGLTHPADKELTATKQWPDVSEAALLDALEDWLAPYLDTVHRLQDFKKLDLQSILNAQLSWESQQVLTALAPKRLTVASGSSIAIDYGSNPPVLAVKLQEMFGCETTPSIANGKVALLVHLLSPAGRPLQITQDLAGFWRASYHAVKKDMKGRYPKHPWPDNPLLALPTRKTKKRLK